MQIEKGKTYLFTKSGNWVTAIKKDTPYMKQEMWQVKRNNKNKEMIVPAKALLSKSDLEKNGYFDF
jgi:hypothetical protein